MAEKIIRTIIQLRRDTEANWKVSEYIGKAGEPMITLDGEHKGHIKMGDGESLWSALPYITDGSGQPVTVQVDGTSIVDTEGVLGLDGFASAIAGQQPRKAADGTLEWYTPDTSSVSGLQEAVGQLQTDVDALEAVVGNSGSGLVHDVANNTTLIESLTSNLADNYDTSTEVDEKIKSAISSTYKAAGSAASVEAITADAEHLGYVYNMSAEFTTTEAFVEGAGNTYPAGTNVVVVETNAEPATYGLDVLSGFVDLSGLATKEEVTEISDAVTANKTILDSLPKQVLVDLVNVSRSSTTNTAEIQIATKQSDGTFTTSEKHGVLTLVGADMLNAGLMTASDKNKLDGIQINAEKNKINMIMVDAVEQPIAAGAVNISCATTDGSEAGVVKSSSGENKVTVETDGTMTVASLNVNKLVVSDDDQFIIDGGGANS